ncbi:unnamed protein product [Candida verbasci]|uniref:non-specific serine/threonine protein kinase n=1 Tax=Candida verbasci TaxID=1227364 RepID=A0A9W4TTV7_9ASCO|nr:unnamed protein product [Candida verbasci]
MAKKKLYKQYHHNNDKENDIDPLNESNSSSSPMNTSPTPSPTYKYGLWKCIGKGNFGDVYRAKDLTAGKFVAIKVINLDDSPDDVKQILREIHFLSRLSHANVIQYFESFTQHLNMFIVMEYCGGGSCSELIKYHKKLNEDIVSYIIKNVLLGLQYLHGERKVHRDIKAANVLLTENGDVKLGDFGVSGEMTFTKLKKNTFVGTPFWMAPEVIIKGKKASNNTLDEDDGYDYKADIWSTGITTIELVTGSPPLAQFDPLKILFEIPKKKPPILFGLSYSPNLKDFIRYCLLKDPDKRPSTKSLLHHHYITKQIPPAKAKEQLVQLIQMKILYNETNNVRYKPRFKLNSTVIDDNDQENVINWELTKTMATTILTEKNMESTTKSDINNKSSILFYCLERVYLRGKDEETRNSVEKLIQDIYKCEKENPGLCHALVEEIEKCVK